MVSAKNVVLGLLVEQKGYAWEVQQRLDARFAFLGFSRKVIYGVLNSLEQEGLVTVVDRKPQSTLRSPPRPIYAVTERGEEEFVAWLGEPCELVQVREEIHVKLVLCTPLHWPRVIAMADGLERACLTAVQELRAFGRPTLEELMDADPPDRVMAAALVDDAELLRLRATMEWLQRVRLLALKKRDRASEDR